ncbi:MAG: hypothetical protein SFU86_04640 [Pirellulaceae bacterium]|nr:hypothetical protein [Pirellulaceae bacterium]
MSENPYRPPTYPQPLPVAQLVLPPATEPTVWLWYKVYCWGMALLYVGCVIGGVCLFLFADEIASDTEEKFQLLFMGIFLPLIGVPLTLLFAAGALWPRSKFAWMLGFVTIGIGLTGGCTILPCIFLLIEWLKPETKRYLVG